MRCEICSDTGWISVQPDAVAKNKELLECGEDFEISCPHCEMGKLMLLQIGSR